MYDDRVLSRQLPRRRTTFSLLSLQSLSLLLLLSCGGAAAFCSAPGTALVVARRSALSAADSDDDVVRAKADLRRLSTATDRGFACSDADRLRARDAIDTLARRNPTAAPAAAYYPAGTAVVDPAIPTLRGKWTLVYTDAPDITSLAATTPTARLGRIGQECTSSDDVGGGGGGTIKNVIEWRRPAWAASLPFAGDDDARVLQQVCCGAAADPATPTEVALTLVGLELRGSGAGGGPGAWLADRGPVELRGPLTLPFGRFDVLYLDEEMRITRTDRGYYAVNVREEEWF